MLWPQDYWILGYLTGQHCSVSLCGASCTSQFVLERTKFVCLETNTLNVSYLRKGKNVLLLLFQVMGRKNRGEIQRTLLYFSYHMSGLSHVCLISVSCPNPYPYQTNPLTAFMTLSKKGAWCYQS